MTFDKSQFFQVFYEETEEHLCAMEELLLNLETASPGQEDLDAIFRAVHSIKGGAGTFGFKEMTEVAHIFESVLDCARKGDLSLTGRMIDLFLESGDVLKGILSAYRNNADVIPEASRKVQHQLQAILEERHDSPEAEQGHSASASGSGSTEPEAEEDPGFGFFDDLPECAPEPEKKVSMKKGPVAEADPSSGFFEEKRASDAPGRRESDQTASENPSRLGRRASDQSLSAPKPAAAASIRIDIEKVDQLFNQVGEIVIAQAMLSETASHLNPESYERIQAGLAQLEQNTRDLQESVMAIRMVPIRTVFKRFPRLIRDMTRKLNKEAELLMIGEDTEIDKGFVEKLVDPLTHLLRNSFDHGIELPEARRTAGKRRKGRITLRASHLGGNVVIEVSDDGVGLNRDRLLAKASEKGLSLSEDPSDQEVWNLIFAPGFSTARALSDLSGRGVGMDVVKKNVQAMGGRVDIESVPGQGSRFMIRLPLTLAIIEGMVVRVGGEVYILPLISIVESIRPKPSERTSFMGRGELVNLRGEYLPVIRLYERFGILGAETDPCLAVLVIVDSQAGRMAVMVDELIGQQQVVIKSLEENYRKVPGLGGATILGNGKAAFILDVRELLVCSKKEEDPLRRLIGV